MTTPLCAVLALVLLLVLAPAGCRGYKPRINPSVPELIKEEGESLEITCTSINDINVEFPESSEIKGIITSEHQLTPENDEDLYKTKFIRKETVFGDTGWYGCVDAKANIPDEKNYDDPNASWVYVYVKSNQTAFVETELRTFFPEVGESVVLPCRPTSPHLHVTLTKDGKDHESSEKLSFNPKEGFKVENLSVTDGGYFQCWVDQDGITESVDYFVTVVKKKTLKKPQISKNGLEYVTTGSSLHINCSVQVGIEHTLSFEWTTPRNSSTSRVLKQVVKKISPDFNLAISEFVEDNVTFDDEGEYVCSVKSLSEVASTKIYVHVHDSSNSFINLTSDDISRHYTIYEGQAVTFSGTVRGFPQPEVIWEGPSGKQIVPNLNFVIENRESSSFPSTQRFSTLKIGLVKLKHSGVYHLMATNGEQVKRLNFTLDVLGKPATYLNDLKAFYSLNKHEKFSCKINSNPRSNITWTYKKCPDMNSLEDCQTIELENYEIIKKSDKWTFTDVVVKIDMFGFINCSACNTYGCDSAVTNIIVTDGVTNGTFGIVDPEVKVTIGDDITLKCTALIYNYTNVQWYYRDTELPMENSEKYEILFKDTNFTHQTHLVIKNLTNSDELTYHCRAKCSDCDEYLETTHFNLKLEDPQKPTLLSSNLNNTEVTKTTEEAHNFNLSCFFEGMPKPEIVWLQNNGPMKLPNKQYRLYNDSQTISFIYLMESDSGTYSCLVQNRFGFFERRQKIIVKGSERILRIFLATIVGLVFAIILVIVCCCFKVRREQRMRKQLIEAGLMHFEEGAPECLNPDLTVDDQADLLPYDRKWEFPRDKLKLGKQLGSGAFGVVMKARAYGIIPDEPVTTVAVKMVRRNAENAYIRALASELKIMVHLGKHLNVVNLLGACTNNIAKKELLVIVEYCRFGNLHNYLLRHRESFIDQIDPSTGEIDPSIGIERLERPTSVGSNGRLKYAALSFSRSMDASSGNTAPGTETVVYYTDNQGVGGLPNEGFINSNGSQPGWRSNYRGDYKDRNLKPICSQDLLSWAYQVATGMEYLSSRKVLHGDLAARNILLAEGNVVKICDFGLAKTMYKDDNYQKNSDGPVPIKWMAIESIRDRLFSTQSDVWSFGIVLWEFFTLAETPYPGMQAEMQYQRLIEGYRMEKPKYATREIYEIMRECWKAKPALRPSFKDLVDDIGALLEENVKRLYEELNVPNVIMNNAEQEGKDDYLTMMSAPDHIAMSSPHDYVNDPGYLTIVSEVDDRGSKVFSPTRPNSTPRGSRFQFPTAATAESAANAANSDGEDAPMLKKAPQETDLDDDNYLKPIDVNKKRENFMKQHEVEKKREKEQSTKSLADRDSGYCNTPKGLELMDIQVECEKNRKEGWKGSDETDTSSVIKTTEDSYVNMKDNALNKGAPDSFTNPSYIYVEASKSDEEML